MDTRLTLAPTCGEATLGHSPRSTLADHTRACARTVHTRAGAHTICPRADARRDFLTTEVLAA